MLVLVLQYRQPHAAGCLVHVQVELSTLIRITPAGYMATYGER